MDRAKRSALLGALLGLAIWAGPAAADLFSSTGPVIAVLGEELFTGEAEGHLNGSGTLLIQSQRNAAVSCRGQFTSSAALGGTGHLQCSDGATAAFLFQRLTLRSGHGSASFTRGPMTFTYGLTAAQSSPYLVLPAGRTLVANGKNLHLGGTAPAPAAAPVQAATAKPAAVTKPPATTKQVPLPAPEATSVAAVEEIPEAATTVDAAAAEYDAYMIGEAR